MPGTIIPKTLVCTYNFWNLFRLLDVIKSGFLKIPEVEERRVKFCLLRSLTLEEEKENKKM